MPFSCSISISDNVDSPKIDLMLYGVFTIILPSFSFFLISFKVCAAPLNSFLLWIRVISFELESSKAQSKAESPPPKIDSFLFLKRSLLVTEYNICLPSNFSASFKESFLGSKDPTPPAMIILGAVNLLLLFKRVNK